MGLHGTPSMPLYIYKGLGDQVSPIADTDTLVKTYCSKGATIEYRRNLVSDHITETILGSANALEWVSDRLDGKKVANAGRCTTKNVMVGTLSPNSLDFIGTQLSALMVSLFGGQLGGVA